MRTFIINGIFVCHALTGVERVAFGLLEELDKTCGEMDIELVIPEYAQIDAVYDNIRVIRYGKKTGPLWVQFDYTRYVRKRKGTTIGLGSYMPFLFRNGITWLHDIRDVVLKYCTPLKYRILATVSCYFRCYWSEHVVTISEFSKNEIMRVFKIPSEKISVIYDGCHNFSSETIFNFDNTKYPFLQEKKYFFYLGSIVKHKNMKWVIEVAKRNPDKTFVVSGMQIERLKSYNVDDFNLGNVHYLGYLDDYEVAMMMKYCKAFIFPSLYEGFGMPPLEALNLGAPIIISNTSAHPEIYGDAAHYIDPYNYDVDLENLLAEEVAPPETVLDKYSFKNSARQLCDLLLRYG